MSEEQTEEDYWALIKKRKLEDEELLRQKNAKRAKFKHGIIDIDAMREGMKEKAE